MCVQRNAMCSLLMEQSECVISQVVFDYFKTKHVFVALGTFIGMSLVVCVSFRYVGI